MLRKAYNYASIVSSDLNTQNGAIIVNNGEIISMGANSIPLNVKIDDNRLKRPDKYNYIEHAERNAIYNAAKQGKSTYGATMYCPWFACTDCARAIIQSGIKKVVGHKHFVDGSGRPDNTYVEFFARQ